MTEANQYALKLLAARDMTVAMLRLRLEARFGHVPENVIDGLLEKGYLDDRRFAGSYVARRKRRGAARLRGELLARGVAAAIADEVLGALKWPSLQEALKAKMKVLKLSAPLKPRDTARLFRALLRLGYSDEEIRYALEPLNEQPRNPATIPEVL